MDQQLKKVQELEKDVRDAHEVLTNAQVLLNQAKNDLQEMCPHDHIEVTDDGDCHSRKYYYTCAMCGHWSRFKPHHYVTLQYT
jgi:hypothetical protein